MMITEEKLHELYNDGWRAHATVPEIGPREGRVSRFPSFFIWIEMDEIFYTGIVQDMIGGRPGRRAK